MTRLRRRRPREGAGLVRTAAAAALLGLALDAAPAAAEQIAGGDGTDWDAISPHLLQHWASSLPPLPQVGLNTSVWQPDASLGAFQVIDAPVLETTFCGGGDGETGGDGGVWPADAVSAGPVVYCDDESPCSNTFVKDVTCKATSVLNAREGVIALYQKHGTFWTRQNAQPAWTQLRFPLPIGTGRATFRFTMDERYPPLTRGGNPCEAAASNSSHECKMCTPALHGGAWDYGAAAGVYVLWTIPGRGGHVITGPLDTYSAYAADILTMSMDSPPELDLRTAGEVVVTLFTFNQYPFSGELVDGVNGYSSDDPLKCSVDWTKNTAAGDLTSNGNTLLIIVRAELNTRSDWEPAPTEPPAERPRIFGSDATWDALHNAPFFDAPCAYDEAVSPGWGGDSGVPDFKSAFERVTLGYATCYASGSYSTPPNGIWAHPEIAVSYGDPDFVSYSGTTNNARALRAFHLVRRMRACHKLHGSDCQFNETETNALAQLIVEREFAAFEPTARERWEGAYWGWEQDSDGCCGYDLHSAVPVKHFSLFIDIFHDDAAAADAEKLAEIEDKLEQYIDLFLQAFDSGHWSLWNGNNWTPVLSAAAVYWVVAYWHEKYEKARKVMHAIVDIMMLLKKMFTSDGVYKEGLCQYSYMSIDASVELAALYAEGFGATFPGVDVELLQRTAQWQMDTFDTAGYAVDFGDSHACRGTDPATLYAALAPAIAGPPGSSEHAEVDACLLRAWSAMAYYIQVGDPFTFWPALAPLAAGYAASAASLNEACSADPTMPFGGAVARAYEEGGYGFFRSPLSKETDIAGDAAGAPELEDLEGYAMLALQARPNEFPHSEVDFGTFIWSAHGVRLISEHGYGTISTAVGQWDFRRYAAIDNNPAGHNTVVIKEAYKGDTGEINFSQLHQRRGTITQLSTSDVECMHLNGGPVYGSEKENGWFSYMHRWACDLGEGAFLVVDAFAAQPNRTTLDMYGSLYGGPDFNEGTVHRELEVEEYFHTPSWLNNKDLSEMDEAAMQFDRSLAGKWCSHVNVSHGTDSESGNTVYLRSLCGPAPYTDGDAVGRVTAWSEKGGHFEVDGLVSAADRWGTPTLHMHRFRYASNEKVGPAGDLRAFVLTSARGADAAPPPAALGAAPCPPRFAAAPWRCLAVTAEAEEEPLVIAVAVGGDEFGAASFATCYGADCEVAMETSAAPSSGQCSRIPREILSKLASLGFKPVPCGA